VPAKNIYHSCVIEALQKDGWTITDDPLTLTYGGRDLYCDLGAEYKTLAAEKGGRRIAVEISSFLSPSPIHDLEEALGQYNIYRAILDETEPGRQVYLAVPMRVYNSVLADQFGQLVIAHVGLRVIVFDSDSRTILKWIN